MTPVVLTVVLVVLVVNLLVSLARVSSRASGRELLLGVVLAGTTGAALLVVASVRYDVAALRDTALVMMALATVVVVVRVSSERSPCQGGPGPSEDEGEDWP